MFQKPNPWKWSTFIISIALACCISWYLLKGDPVRIFPEHILNPEDEEIAILSQEETCPDGSNPVMRFEDSSAPKEPIRRISTINRGENIYKVLLKYGISHTQIFEILKKTKRTFDLSRIMPGHELILVFSPDNQNLVGIEYEISTDYRLIVTIDEDNIQAYKKTSETG